MLYGDHLFAASYVHPITTFELLYIFGAIQSTSASNRMFQYEYVTGPGYELLVRHELANVTAISILLLGVSMVEWK
jgi:hypothetical protein